MPDAVVECYGGRRRFGGGGVGCGGGGDVCVDGNDLGVEEPAFLCGRSALVGCYCELWRGRESVSKRDTTDNRSGVGGKGVDR